MWIRFTESEQTVSRSTKLTGCHDPDYLAVLVLSLRAVAVVARLDGIGTAAHLGIKTEPPIMGNLA